MSSETRTRVARATPAPIPSRTWRLAVVLALGGVMAGLDSSIVNVGLATIGHDLGSSLAVTQWISSGYLLALAAALPVCGWLSRRLGAGRLWLWSLVAFTATSALCALSGTVELLIGFRVLQGLAGGVLAAASMTVLAQAAGPAQLGRLMATTSVPAILAPGIGPVLGAVLLSRSSWPWLFLLNLPVGVAGLVLGLLTVPRACPAEQEAAGPLDVRGLVLVTPGMPLLVHAITQAAAHRSLLTPAAAVPLLLALGLLTGFVRHCLTTSHPLVDLRLLGDRVYRAAAFEVLINGAALFGGLIVMPLYFQLLLTRNIIDTGWLLVPFSLGAAAAFPVAGRLTDRFGGGRVTVLGLTLTVASTLPFALQGAQPNVVLVEVLQVLRGVGLALSGMPVVALALGTVTRHQLPDATTQINILSRVGGALGSALFVVALTSGLDDGATGAVTLDAFRTTFWWLTTATILALLSAGWLLHETRRADPHPAPLPTHPDPPNSTEQGDSPMTRIAIITGSTRPGRKSLTVARWVHDNAKLRTDATFDVVDIADHDLPHLQEPVAAAMSTDYQHPTTRRWSTTIAAYDGFVLVTPEYNHSIPGVLKNAIDHLYTEWNDKAAGFVSYGTHGGTRAVEQLRLVMAELQVADVRAQVTLSLFTDFTDAKLTPGNHQSAALNTTLDQVVRWANALTPLRHTQSQ